MDLWGDYHFNACVCSGKQTDQWQFGVEILLELISPMYPSCLESKFLTTLSLPQNKHRPCVRLISFTPEKFPASFIIKEPGRGTMALKESWKGGFKSVTPKHDLLYTNYTDMKSFKEKAVPTRMHRPLIAIKNLSFCVSKSGFRGMITIWIKDTRSKSKSFHFRNMFQI